MKSHIRSSVSWAVTLDEEDQFILTGRENYGVVDYTILVEAFSDGRVEGLGREEEPGLNFRGRRQLKSGKKSYQTKTLVLADGDPNIPADIAELANELRSEVERIRELLKKEI